MIVLDECDSINVSFPPN